MNPLDKSIDKSYSASKSAAANYSDKLSSDKTMTANVKQTVSELSPGDRIRGVVTNIIQREVTLSLDQSTVLTGRLNDTIALSIGQNASFEVITSSQNQLLLRFLPEAREQAQAGLILKALDAANLPDNERNQNIVKELLNQQLSIDSGSIHKLYQQTLAFKDISLSTLAAMNRYNIPVTQETAQQFEAYRNYEHRILLHLQNISGQFISVITQADTAQAQTAHQNLLEMLASNPGTDSSVLLNNDLTLSSPSDFTDLQEQPRSFIEQTFLNTEETVPSDVRIKQEQNLAQAAELNSIFLQDKAAGSMTASLRDSGLFAAENTGIQSNISGNPDSALSEAVSVSVQEASLGLTQDQALSSMLSSDSLKGLSDFFAQNEFFSNTIPSEILSKINTGKISVQALLSTLSELSKAPVSQTVVQSALSDLAKDPAYQELLQKSLQHRWTLSPSELTKENAIDQYYSKLSADILHTEQLTNSASLSEAAGSLSKSVENLKDMLDFQTLLNQLFPYIQMPIRFSDKTTHSELYVYTKKEALRKNPHEVSVLLHLDMEQLGPLDVFLNLKDTSINSRFYLEDKNSAAIVSQHLPELSSSLQSIGYSLTSEVILREASTDPVRDFIALDHPAGSVKRYTFDMRA